MWKGEDVSDRVDDIVTHNLGPFKRYHLHNLSQRDEHGGDKSRKILRHESNEEYAGFAWTKGFAHRPPQDIYELKTSLPGAGDLILQLRGGKTLQSTLAEMPWSPTYVQYCFYRVLMSLKTSRSEELVRIKSIKNLRPHVGVGRKIRERNGSPLIT
ncbi:hypothetical protein TNCV_1325371 [Trichonephila clavipes]|nr:hypothetical protein TNCV_1325371 [Trichonephila clavipes]